MLKSYVRRHPVKTQRFLEILPGFFSWSLILFPFWGSFVFPVAVAYYVITFTVYWLYRSFTLAILSVVAHLKIKASSHFDWPKDLQNTFPKTWDSIHHIIIIPTYHEPLSTLERTLEALKKQSYPLKNIHIMMSFEEREGEAAHDKSKKRNFAIHLAIYGLPFTPTSKVKSKESLPIHLGVPDKQNNYW
jgi:hypothetical protein